MSMVFNRYICYTRKEKKTIDNFIYIYMYNPDSCYQFSRAFNKWFIYAFTRDLSICTKLGLAKIQKTKHRTNKAYAPWPSHFIVASKRAKKIVLDFHRTRLKAISVKAIHSWSTRNSNSTPSNIWYSTFHTVVLLERVIVGRTRGEDGGWRRER